VFVSGILKIKVDKLNLQWYEHGQRIIVL